MPAPIGAVPKIWGSEVMSIVRPEIEFVDRTTCSIRYLEHGWPTGWHSHEEYELHLIVVTRGKAFVGVRDMLVQFNQQNIDELSDAFPEPNKMRPMFDLARSGIKFVDFNPTFAKGHLEAIRDVRGAERIVAFLQFLVRVNEHTEKKQLSVVSIFQPEGNSKQIRKGVQQVVHQGKPSYLDLLRLWLSKFRQL
ncbi:hypothetical protein [Maritalea sp.]|uniref:hypothetical protein n=1 Tax=Maritalea sp. TaxID=2003361 RepID=UPI003EF13B06